MLLGCRSVWPWSLALIAVTVPLIAGCGDDTTETAGGGGGDGGEGGTTVGPEPPDAGITGWSCAPGELLLPDDTCLPAGVPADQCGVGFVTDDDGGCDPVLPSQECAQGSMALMGETSCREVAPCGSGTWGDIPTDGATQHVDLNYGGSSDGSAGQPWTSIQAGIDAATDGAIVAIAAGSYQESLLVQGKAVRLWGRCPAMVQVTSSSATPIRIRWSASEVRNLAVTAPTQNVLLNVGGGATGVIVDRVWLHDGAFLGLDIEGGNPGATLARSLIEDIQGTGVFGYGAAITVEDSVIRNISPRASDGNWGEGIRVWDDAVGVSSDLQVRRTFIATTHTAGVFVRGSPLVLSDCLIRDTLPTPAGMSGNGVHGYPSVVDGDPANLLVSTSVVEGSHRNGIVADSSELWVEHTVVRDVKAVEVDGVWASVGIAAITLDDQPRAALTVRSSLVEKTRVYGIVASGADAVVEATIVRDTEPIVTGIVGGVDVGGRGIGVENRSIDVPASLVVRGVVIERTHEMALGALGGEVEVESTRISDVAARSATDGLLGRGINIQIAAETGVPSSGLVSDSLVERAHDHGIMVLDSEATIESTRVRQTMQADNGMFGRGIGVQGGMYRQAPVQATLRRVEVEDSYEAGLFIAWGDVVVDRCIIRDTQPRPVGGMFGDGIIAMPWINSSHSSALQVVDSIVESSQRVGIGNWGSQATIDGSLLSCNTIDLNGEPYQLLEFSFEDLGGNHCLCGDEIESCKTVSSELVPPEPSTL